MTTKNFVLFSFFVLLFACQGNNKTKKSSYEIYKIELAMGGCYGPCPVQVFSVDSSLTLKYYGVSNSERIGFYVGKIDLKLWDSINYKYKKLCDEQPDTLNGRTVDDLITELIIYNKKGVKKIQGSLSDLPKDVRKEFNWLFKKVLKLQMIKTTDSLKFETKVLPSHVEFIPPMPD